MFQRIARIMIVTVTGGVVTAAIAYIIFGVTLAVQWIAYGHPGPSIAVATEATGTLRKLIALPAVVWCAGIGWWLLTRRRPVVGLASAVDDPHAELSARRTLADSLLQITVISAGASAGREGAPRQAAAAAADALARRAGLEWPDRRLVLAAGSGAGLAVVYGTPWAAIPFALTVTIGQWRSQGVAMAAAMAWIATALTSPIHHLGPAYPVMDVPSGDAAAIYAWAAACVPVCAFGGYLMEHLCVSQWLVAMRTANTPMLAAKMAAVGVVTAVLGLALPPLLANGSAAVGWMTGQPGPSPAITLAACLSFVAVKPLLTALSFRYRMLGGLLMPSAAVGAAVGASAASALALVGISLGAPTAAAFAAVGCAAFLAVIQHSPLFAIVFVIELTALPVWMWPALALACAGSHAMRVLASRIRNRGWRT